MEGFLNWGKASERKPVVDAVVSESSSVGLLVPAEVNGEAVLVGTVQFSHPSRLRHLLNPLVKVRDAEGNVFRVRGLLGHVIAVESAKRQQPAGVVCVKRGEKEFDVVKWF